MDFVGAYSWINIRFLLEGLWMTVLVALIAIIFSFIIGSIIGLVRYMKMPYVSKSVGVITDVIRNLPLLLIIFFTYFALPKIGVRLDIFWSVVAAMTVFESAMVSEIIRGGLKSIPKGQMEAARSTGLTYLQAMFSVVMPQALRKMIPPIVSQFISLIKDTSLAVVIALPEVTHNAKIIYGQDTSFVIPMFVAMAAFYFIVCYALSLVAKRLEVKLG
ncbi:amino acid ABC transporter permease [Brochothrix campestris]|uniref:Amino ABC transporter permease n=1 Tax=Brochothrix campestris FSL F6-1037 TaxID=1265861 RepID=W7DA68_9LIST|nr:amino acid ABC transporter permease [Brochothrix campestris]EUJ42153.1 amino ABC transporter permease [Brochothrix campestris FSL F6-1037]